MVLGVNSIKAIQDENRELKLRIKIIYIISSRLWLPTLASSNNAAAITVHIFHSFKQKLRKYINIHHINLGVPVTTLTVRYVLWTSSRSTTYTVL